MGLFGRMFGKKADPQPQAASGGTGDVEDPVCHMRIAPSKAAGTSTHGRQTYHFCSAACKARFDQDPHRFLGAHHH